MNDMSKQADRPLGRRGRFDRFDRFAATATVCDEGAGTVLGIIMITIATVMIVVAVGVGQILVGRSRAATAADMSALSAANALWSGGEPCEVAARAAEGQGAHLISCDVGGDAGEDVLVQVGVDVGMPFLPDMIQSARAGPTVCE